MFSVQHKITSNPATQFIDTIAQNGMSINYDLLLPSRAPSWIIRAVNIVATENLAYELWLCSRAVNSTGILATQAFLGLVGFAAIGANGAGAAVTGDALFRYYAGNLVIPYVDLDAMTAAAGTNQPSPNVPHAALHVRLVNRSAGAKTAGAPGALSVSFFCAPSGM